MTTKLQRENCAKLADLLETVPAKQFDMSLWASFDPDSQPEAGHSCGTVGCAMGWAAVSGQFQDQGLSYGLQFDDSEGQTRWALTRHEVNKGYKDGYEPECIFKGELIDFDDAGLEVFGEQAVNDVFLCIKITQKEAVTRLRLLAHGKSSAVHERKVEGMGQVYET